MPNELDSQNLDAITLSEVEKVRHLAGQIKDNRQFRKILKSAKPTMREEVYNMIAPHLSFKPWPYNLIRLFHA